ncbi:MAG: glycerol-3-phosphate responsive antiterminator [Symbiobacteriia bacterium]
MQPEQMLAALAENAVIAAVRNERDLAEALAAPVRIIFILASSIFSLPATVETVHRAGKLVLAHVDMVQGISRDGYGVQLVAQNAHPDGVISTKVGLVAEARNRGLLAVQRSFLLDSQSLTTGIELIRDARPDIIEVLPGIIPSEIQELVRKIRVPLIAGGLIRTKAQCHAALRAGAAGVSTSRRELWTTPISPKSQG